MSSSQPNTKVGAGLKSLAKESCDDRYEPDPKAKQAPRPADAGRPTMGGGARPRRQERRPVLLFGFHHGRVLPPILRRAAAEAGTCTVSRRPCRCGKSGISSVQALQAERGVVVGQDRGYRCRRCAVHRGKRRRSQPSRLGQAGRFEPVAFSPVVQACNRIDAQGVCRRTTRGPPAS